MGPSQRVIIGFLLGVSIFLLVEAFLFRTNLYRRALLPFSTTGSLEMVLDAERTRPIRHPNQILAIGDSRMALRTWLANRLGTKYTFAFAGIAGSLPRVWRYLIRDVDPTRNRYAAILLPVEDYDDEDWEDIGNRSTDLRYLIYRLRYRDLPEFAGSFTTQDLKLTAARGIMLRGMVLKDDFIDFLNNPASRIDLVSGQTRSWYGVQEDFVGSDKTMEGLSIDWSAHRATYPPRLNAAERKTVDDVLLRGLIPQTGRKAAYMRQWFGKVIDQYQGSRTKLIFYRMPRGPLIRPAGWTQKKTHSIRDLAARPNTILLDEHLFDSLEKPEFFMDPLHLNAEGCRLFTEVLTRKVSQVLGE